MFSLLSIQSLDQTIVVAENGVGNMIHVDAICCVFIVTYVGSSEIRVTMTRGECAVGAGQQQIFSIGLG
jgi:hypothetical protein